MATLTTTHSGSTPGYSIQWYDGTIRRTLYLGGRRYSHKTAERLKEVIETLLYYRYNSVTAMDKVTAAWLQQAHEDIRQKLAKVGLIDPPQHYTCRHMWDTFFKYKTDVKDGTLRLYKDSEKKFFTAFSPDEPIESITHERIVLWKSDLLKSYSTASVACYLKQVKTVFNWAVDSKWCSASPLAKVPLGSFVNTDKDRLITMDEYRSMLSCCPNQEWRVIIAFARIGGIRCPSELLAMTWKAIDWKRNRFTVISPKTKRYEGKERRVVPLFKELRKELEAYKEDSEDNIIHVSKGALYSAFKRIAAQAGMEEIDRPFDNMRMSRSNEVLKIWGSEKESLWIGHSKAVMQKHYLKLTDNDYEEASENIC
jgi:integrase